MTTDYKFGSYAGRCVIKGTRNQTTRDFHRYHYIRLGLYMFFPPFSFPYLTPLNHSFFDLSKSIPNAPKIIMHMVPRDQFYKLESKVDTSSFKFCVSVALRCLFDGYSVLNTHDTGRTTRTTQQQQPLRRTGLQQQQEDKRGGKQAQGTSTTSLGLCVCFFFPFHFLI